MAWACLGHSTIQRDDWLLNENYHSLETGDLQDYAKHIYSCF